MAKKIDRKYLDLKWNYYVAGMYNFKNIDEYLELVYLRKPISFWDILGLIQSNKFKLEENYLKILNKEIYRKILNGEIDTYGIFNEKTELPNLKDLEKVYNIYKLTE
jgi:hypothetical protein